MKNRTQRRSRKGFTLMEILLVLAILVILGGMVTFYFQAIQEGAYVDATTTQIKAFESMLETYRLNVGSYPTTSQGLNALREAPADLANPNKWRGPYMDGDEVPTDPWGNQYQYELSSGNKYRIWSFGPDMVEGTQDDVE